MKSQEYTYADLSHTIYDGLITYQGLPGPVICDFMSREASREHYEEGAEFQIDKIEMIGNSGTYLDTPFHRYADGHDLAELKLEQVANLEGIVIPANGESVKAIDPEFFLGYPLAGKAVLIYTGWDQHWNTPDYFHNHPFLTRAAAQFLLESNVKLVGIDSYNVDDTRGKKRPVHSILLRNNIPIIEHMTGLDALPDKHFHLSAVPPKIEKVGTFPVRVFAWW